MTVTETNEARKSPANELVRDNDVTPAQKTCLGARKDGERCGSKILGSDGYCNLHSPTRALDPIALGRQGGERSGERRHEQSKSVRDLLRERVEENLELIWGAFESSLSSDDERTRIVAATSVLAEAYGRPPQAIIGDASQPVMFVLDSLLARAAEETS